MFSRKTNTITNANTFAKAKAFVALAKDEDFGMTVVEAQAAGTPVIAFNGGGFKESVIDGNLSAQAGTGILIDDISEKSLSEAIEKIEKTKWDKKVLLKNAERFSKERFKKEMREYVESRM